MSKVVMSSLVKRPQGVSEDKRLDQLLRIKEQIEATENVLNGLVERHDEIASEIGAPRIGKQKRSSDEELEECRAGILTACHTPQRMNDLFDLLGSRFGENTIRAQARNLLDDGQLIKLGERGVNVMYIHHGFINVSSVHS